MREKTNVNDVDRSMYDFRNEEKDVYRVKEGLTPAIVEKISSEKHDPVWMQNFRLESLQIYNEMKVPDWGPSIEGLTMDDIVTYVRPNTKMSAKWSDVPEDIKSFEGFAKASEEELKAHHSKMPHGGFVIRTGETGCEGNKHVIEYSLKLDSNPEFTGSVLVAYARAAYRLSKKGESGARSVFDIAPAMLSQKTPEELRASML